MEQTFQIGEIARFFQIPASTLRYWEEMGLFSPQKNQWSRYRKYTAADLMTISDVLFYKNLGLPLKQIRDMEQKTPVEHRDLFEKKIKELEEQKLEIDRRIRKLHFHLSAIEKLQELKDMPFTETDIDTEYIMPFELIEIDKLRQYIGDPYLYSRVQHTEAPGKEKRGLAITAGQARMLPTEQILWKKSSSRYIACLLKEEITDSFPNNLPKLLEHVQKKHKTGYIISRFLLCAKEDGVLYDFYKTYIEVQQQPPAS